MPSFLKPVAQGMRAYISGKALGKALEGIAFLVMELHGSTLVVQQKKNFYKAFRTLKGIYPVYMLMLQ